MQHLEGSGTHILYIGRRFLKVKLAGGWGGCYGNFGKHRKDNTIFSHGSV